MFNSESNAIDLDRALSDLARRQMPFATARALTATARGLVSIEEAQLRRDLDNPTPFTLRGVYMRPATKARPVGEVGIKKIQAQYLERQATGGTRRPEGRALVIPVGQRVNKYGNLPRRAIARLLARPDVFSGKVKGVAGIWQRPKSYKGSPKLLVRYEAKAEYKPQFKFEPTALDYVRRNFPPELERSLRQAIASAR